MKKPISVGVVGCGYWGPNLIRNFKSLPDCNLKAMCDMSEARLKHLRSVYSDVQARDKFRAFAQWHGTRCDRHRHLRQAPLSSG